MNITIIIIVLTFIHTIIDKFVLNEERIIERNKSSFFFRIIKSRYTLAILLIFLLAFQIISEFSSNKATIVRDTNATTAYDTLYATHNTVKKVNSSVDSLLSNIDSTLNITKDELKLIINVNDDLEKVRKEINNSVNDYSGSM